MSQANYNDIVTKGNLRRQRMRKKRDPQGSRRRLLEAAKKLFAERGYHGTGVDHIVAEAGINKRMLYHYFGDKAGLYAKCLEEVYGKLNELESALMAVERPASEMVAALLDAYMHFDRENPYFVRLLMWHNLTTGLPQDHRPHFSKESTIQSFTQAVRTGVATKNLTHEYEPRFLLISLISLCYVFHSNRRTLSEGFGMDLSQPAIHKQWLDHITRFALTALGSETAHRAT